jgi:hypothetical protein
MKQKRKSSQHSARKESKHHQKPAGSPAAEVHLSDFVKN